MGKCPNESSVINEAGRSAPSVTVPLPRGRSRMVPADPGSPSSVLGRGWELGAGASTSLSERQGPGYVVVRAVPYAWPKQKSVRPSVHPSPYITDVPDGIYRPHLLPLRCRYTSSGPDSPHPNSAPSGGLDGCAQRISVSLIERMRETQAVSAAEGPGWSPACGEPLLGRGGGLCLHPAPLV